MACSVPTSGRYRQAATRAGSGLFVALFLRHFDKPRLAPYVPVVGPWRTAKTASCRRVELEAIRQMIRRYG